jgi:hypothetical protein
MLFYWKIPMTLLFYLQVSVSITPSNANAGQRLSVDIVGNNTLFSQASNLIVRLNSENVGYTIEPESKTVISDTLIRAVFDISSNAEIGMYMIIVSALNGFWYLPSAFEVRSAPTEPPAIVSINPSSANTGQTLDVTITGANMDFWQTSPTSITFYNQATSMRASTFAVQSSSTILATLDIPSNMPSGFYHARLFVKQMGFMELENALNITTTSLNEYAQKKAVIYPNPTQGFITITAPQTMKSLTITDIAGKVLTPPQGIPIDNTTYVLNLTEYGIKRGIYFVKTQFDNGDDDYQKIIVE